MKWLGRSLVGFLILSVAVVVAGVTYLGTDSGPKNVDSDTQVEDLELPDICDENCFVEDGEEAEAQVATLTAPQNK